MEVSQDAVSIVRSWLPTTPKQGQAKSPHVYTQISPRPDRLGLGAESPAKGTDTTHQEKVLNERIQKKLIGNKRQRLRLEEDRGHLYLASKSRKTVSSQRSSRPVFSDSASDEDCSKSTAISWSKTRPPTFSIDNLTSDSKRKRRRKARKSKKISVDEGRTPIHGMYNDIEQDCNNAQSASHESRESTLRQGTSALKTNLKSQIIVTPTLLNDIMDDIFSVFPESVQSELELGFGTVTPYQVIQNMARKKQHNLIKTGEYLREKDERTSGPSIIGLKTPSHEMSRSVKKRARLIKRRRKWLVCVPQRKLVDRLFTYRQLFTLRVRK